VPGIREIPNARWQQHSVESPLPVKQHCWTSQQWHPCVAHPFADLDQSEAIQPIHLNEAINYRMLDWRLEA
jgi:predicted ATPase with chaperone activity